MSVHYREYLSGQIIYCAIGASFSLEEFETLDAYMLDKLAEAKGQVYVVIDMFETVKYPLNVPEIRRHSQFLKSPKVEAVLHLVRDRFQKMLGDSVVALSFRKYKSFLSLDDLLAYLAEQNLFIELEAKQEVNT